MVIYNNKQTSTSAMVQSSVYGPMLCGYIVFDIFKGKDIY
jgi:hypothetical protein